jgi:hypothetical protein
VTVARQSLPIGQRLRELPWQDHRGSLAVVVVLLATAAAAAWHGAGLALLVLAGAGLLTAIGALWVSVRAIFGEVPMDVEDAYALAAPAGADDQKRALLRALEDLEYERRVGKISEQDFGELGTRYRAEAKRLLGVEGGASRELRREVEQLVRDHLGRLGLVEEPSTDTSEEPATDTSEEPVADAEEPLAEPGPADTGERASSPRAAPRVPEADAVPAPDRTGGDSSRSAGSGARRKRCGACGAKNEPDAQFCKKCGLRLDARSGRDRGRSSRRGGKRK